MAQAGPLPPQALESLCRALEERIRADQYSTSYTDRIAYARDQWPRSLIKLRQGLLETTPDLIIWPETPQEAADVLAICRSQPHPTSSVISGGGSAVTGATSPQRGGAIIDLKRLNRVRWIDLNRGLAEIEAGVLGMHLEEALLRAGATLGHFPSSIMCSTLGGWAAARSAGQGSSHYGKIEDMLDSLEVATHDGQISWTHGLFDLTPLLVGSEGRLGLITACRVKIHPAPAARSFRGILFPSVKSGLEAIRTMMQSGDSPPTILRLYDPVDTTISSHKRVKDNPENQPPRRSDGVRLSATTQALVAATPPGNSPLQRWRKRLKKTARSALRPLLSQALSHANTSMGILNKVMSNESLMILGCEGPHTESADALLQRHLQLCLQAGGKDLGAAPGWHWFDGRYNVSFKQSTVFLNGAFSDTMEVVARWPQVLPLYHKVREAIQEDAVVMAHFSHAYPEGCSIYFSFAAIANADKELDTYDRIWKRGLEAAASIGAGVSHHHGIGFSKAHAMAHEWGHGGLRLMRALREAYDPDNRLNPGKLDLDSSSQPDSAPSSLTTSQERDSLAELRAQLPHLPWETSTQASAASDWDFFGSQEPLGLHAIALQDWHQVQSVLTHNQEAQVPLYTSKGQQPKRGGLLLHLPLPLHSPPSFQLDEEAMLLECDSRFSIEAIESYARMSGFTTGLQGDTNLTLRQWIDLGHTHLSNVHTIQTPSPIYGLCALLPSGEEIQLGRGPRASSGPDISHLFWQTGGAFGIVKRATLRLRKIANDTLVWRTQHTQLDEAIGLLRELFALQKPPQQVAVWHALPEGPYLLTIGFSPDHSPGIVQRYQQIPEVQELSAFPTPPQPNTPWWLAVSAEWPDLTALATFLRTQAPWPLLRLHLVHANHTQGIWRASFSPSTAPQTIPQGFSSFVETICQHTAIKGLWSDPRFVQIAACNPAHAEILRAIKQRIDPHHCLNPHALTVHPQEEAAQ